MDMNEVFNYITAAQQHTGGAFRETPREALQVRGGAPPASPSVQGIPGGSDGGAAR